MCIFYRPPRRRNISFCLHLHVTFAMGFSVTPIKPSGGLMNVAWLMLLFSGWYVVLLKAEASEGKTLAGRTDMNARLSRFTVSSEKRPVSSISSPRNVFSGKRSWRSTSCAMIYHPAPGVHGSPTTRFGMAERITVPLGGPRYPSSGRVID
jgi:hypothetical protein